MVGHTKFSELRDRMSAESRARAEAKAARYTLAELLAQCDPTAPRSAEDQAWLDDPPVGNEII